MVCSDGKYIRFKDKEIEVIAQWIHNMKCRPGVYASIIVDIRDGEVFCKKSVSCKAGQINSEEHLI